MTYVVQHNYINQPLRVSVATRNGLATVSCSASFSLPIRFPGELRIGKSASYYVHVFLDNNDRRGGSTGRQWHAQLKSIPLQVTVTTPDGKPFTAEQITINDLKRFRDLRGTSQGAWTIKVSGATEPIPVSPEEVRVVANKGHCSVMVQETVTSQSAPPLVNSTQNNRQNRRYGFDLYRVGTFTALARSGSSWLPIGTTRTMTLSDPDGVVVASSTNGQLTYPVTLATLNKSRDKDGKPRPWALHVPPAPGGNLGRPVEVWASVIDTARITTSVLHDRINALIGAGGNKLSIYGEVKEGNILGRLMIKDEISAEIFDMHGLLDSVIESNPQDDGVNKNIKKGVAYTLSSTKSEFGYGLNIALSNAKVTSLNISLGNSVHLQPPVPALQINAATTGEAIVKIGGFSLATVKVRNNTIAVEAGLRLSPNGTFTVESYLTNDLVDVDIHWGAALAAGVLTGGLLALGAIGAAEYIESKINEMIQTGFKKAISGALEKVPQILAMVLGDDFTYRSLRMEGDVIQFEYIAPIEPEPKPSQHIEYRGIMGRSATQVGPNAWDIKPPLMGDTWKKDNLSKIDHIVMVMMENRSFDHVLGYLAQANGSTTSDGLTPELVDFLGTQGYPVNKLSASGIIPNSQGLKTRFPSGVGHELHDVVEQLSERLTTPSGRKINSPKGFVSNFTPRAAKHNGVLTPNDVLGFYEAADLPFYKFLVDNYAYCEKFFCSHPGPTLPNRMFSLTGDLQYDRTGEAIPDNNNGDNFFLSRAMNIFDLLSKKGVSWRVYESFPSVTMLRMFARYATDNTNIVDIKCLQRDIAAGDLKAVTVIDPAMHHYPENDDHSPVADMYNGQLFLKNIYDTLRSNDALWQKTMLVITYDEHGGFYDHVIPPLAEVRSRPMLVQDPARAAGDGPFTPSTQLTYYGVRVPTFVVSPWTVAGEGPELVLDFCSVLKTIIARFCSADKPFVSDRVHTSRSLESFLSAIEPRMNVPPSPVMPVLTDVDRRRKKAIVTAPVFRREMINGNVDYHEISGMLARLLGR